MLNKPDPLSRDKANSGKNFKKNALCILTLMLGSLFLAIGIRYNFVKFSSVIFICLTPFSVIVWTDRLHDFAEGISFPDNCCYDNG